MRVCESVVTPAGADEESELTAAGLVRTMTVCVVRSASGNEMASARATAKVAATMTTVRMLIVTWCGTAVDMLPPGFASCRRMLGNEMA
jgi:hypothetical protein